MDLQDFGVVDGVEGPRKAKLRFFLLPIQNTYKLNTLSISHQQNCLVFTFFLFFVNSSNCNKTIIQSFTKHLKKKS